MSAKYFNLLLVLTLAVSNVSAIFCNFTFIESEAHEAVNYTAETRIFMDNNTSNNAFECEQNIDDYEELTELNDATKSEGLAHRLGSHESFELQELSCLNSKRFITPRALNNIYNQLIQVVNDATVVQKIQITNCRNVREPCNEHLFPSANYRHICWQEYLIIKLLAFSIDGAVFEESFYYPSHCSCRLVKVTRRPSRLNRIRRSFV